MSKRSKPRKGLKSVEWKTDAIEIYFGEMTNQRLGWALKDISEYKAIPIDVYTEITSQIPSPDRLLRNSSGEIAEFNDAISIKLNSIYADWNTLILWVVKDKWKLFNIYDGPLPELVMRVYEPRARLVIAELELWDAIFDVSKEMKTALPHDNCIEGWRATEIESKGKDILNICNGIGTHLKAKNLVKQKAQLMRWENPFHCDDLNEAAPT